MIHKELILSLADEQLVLYGNLSVLGLLLMKNKTIAPPSADSADFSIFKFVQSVVRFPRGRRDAAGRVVRLRGAVERRPRAALVPRNADSQQPH